MKQGTAFWTAHVEAIKREATSTIGYAKRHGLAVKSLYRWQRKLKATAAASADAHQPAAFVALRIAEPLETPRTDSCTLVLDAGLRLEMSALPAPEWLAALARAAQGVH